MSRRVLFVVHDAGGTIPPVLAVAEAMVDDGHDVTILSQPSVGARAERVGAHFIPFASLPDYDRRRPLEEQLERTLPALTGAAVGEDLLAAVDERAADLVVVDPNLTGALAAAETLEASTVVLLHSLHRTYVDVWFGSLWPVLADLVHATRRTFGLVGEVATWAGLFEGHDAVVAAVPTAFDDAPPDARQQHHGFLVPRPRPPAPDDHRVTFAEGAGPRVLVGLSTTYQHHEALLGDVVEALGRLPVQARVTTGDHVALDRSRPVPANVEVVGYADHPTLVADTDLVVTHAGLGTVAVALSSGVPLVCVPIDRDQPLNAARVAALGAGIALDGKTATPDAIAAAVEAVLADDGNRFRHAAQHIAGASRRQGGAPRAARAIAEVGRRN